MLRTGMAVAAAGCWWLVLVAAVRRLVTTAAPTGSVATILCLALS